MEIRDLSTDRNASIMSWRSAAMRQRELLKRSKHKNQQLRESLLEQKKLSKNLQRMLSEREAKNAMGGGSW